MDPQQAYGGPTLGGGEAALISWLLSTTVLAPLPPPLGPMGSAPSDNARHSGQPSGGSSCHDNWPH